MTRLYASHLCLNVPFLVSLNQQPSLVLIYIVKWEKKCEHGNTNYEILFFIFHIHPHRTLSVCLWWLFFLWGMLTKSNVECETISLGAAHIKNVTLELRKKRNRWGEKKLSKRKESCDEEKNKSERRLEMGEGYREWDENDTRVFKCIFS